MSIKRQILEDTFTQPFNIERFVKFTTEFFNGPQILSPYKRNEKVWKEYWYYIDSYRHVAKYIDGKDKNILILAVQLRKGRSVERARSMQRNFISRLISDSQYDAAIVAFYCEDEPTWRLSFVRLDYEFTAKGVKLDLTPAKRYSYLVGEGEPSHTAQEQLLPIFERESYNPTLDEIEHAFSVETVTKDFFEKYREKYYDLKEYLDNNEAFKEEAQRHNFTSEQFAKKLMGQLVFLYFLQKKGWLGVKLLPENRQLTEEEFKKIFYRQNKAGKDVLLKVFPACENGIRKVNTYNLSRLSDEEGDILAGCFKGTEYEKPWESGTRTFIRDLFTYCVENTNKNFFDHFLEPLFYEALNKKRGENHYYPKFNCKIPFLNGGLFEPLDNYDWQHNDFNIPNEIFSNSKTKGREADGILDIFDRYNFTINEDEPLEREVAVDPEMLGKIFENLLDAKDRKSKGAFYTPREIVHYMCQESLINYLVNETGVPYQDIKDFILYGELMKDEDCSKDFEEGKKEQRIPKTVLENLLKIDNALKQVKVADPAVGSGAFPLGMLNEIVKARMNITEYLVRDIPAENKYERFLLRKNRHPYRIKWETIKNSIFAVDIESSAVDIAKLRLWLSLIVDQEIDEENPCPHPLPNLDCNIMCGNSLIDEFEGIKLFDESLLSKQEHSKDNTVESYQISLFQDQIEMLLEDLFKEQDRLYGEEDTAKKMEIKKNIDKIIDSIIRAKLSRDKNKEGLIKYEQSLKEKTKPYFLWKLEFAKIFKEKGGFDIVIGNPPYIGFHHVPDKDYFKQNYFVANGKYDFYVLFIENGLKILKTDGILSFICPSYFYKRNYGKNTRKLILDTTRILYIADFKDFQIFDSALTYTCIFGLQKNTDNRKTWFKVLGTTLNDEDSFKIEQVSLKEPSWSLENESSNTIIKKVKSMSNFTFGSITKSISQGIVTGFNDVFLITGEFITSNCIEMDYLKKVYKGKDIRNGQLIDSNQFVFYPYEEAEDGKDICISENILKQKCPNLYSYLESNKDKLLSRDYFLKSNKKWYELWNPRKKRHFENRKFVFSEINIRNDFVLVGSCYYTDSACGAELKEEKQKYEKYLYLYLNSDLITYVYRKMSVPKANGYLIYKNAFLKELPILINDSIDENISSFENMSQVEFDKLLFNLFNISDDEILLIRNELSTYTS